ncbi:MAG: hypothetical protein JWL75_150 [Parcubacteria group bacterium]|nr:hypothetical protein [Parcubacteria group bacterium]
MLVTIHFIIAIAAALLVLYSDEQVFFWVLGKTKMIAPARVRFMHRSVTTGLTLLLITGGLLYSSAPEAFLSTSTFVVKMVTIFALIINTYFIDRFSGIAVTRTFASLSHAERIPLFITGAVSFAGWVTALTCGLLIG